MTKKITKAGQVEQVFALTIETPITISFPGQLAPLSDTSLAIKLKFESLLVITFSARIFNEQIAGTTIYPPGPIALVKCEIDGAPCEPNGNALEFGNNLGFGDARSFTWVVHKTLKGQHTITIFAGLANPQNAQLIITNRTLVVEAARL